MSAPCSSGPTGAIEQNLRAFAFEDWPIRFTVYKTLPSPEVPAGEVKDITGATAIWVLRTKAGPEGVELIRKDTASGITLIEPTLGQLMVSVSEAENAELAAGNYYHELQVELTGIQKKVAYGTFSVRQTGIRTAA